MLVVLVFTYIFGPFRPYPSSYHIGHDVEGAITEQVKKRGSIMPERGPLFQDVHTMALEIKKTHPSQH